jgi:hypothetical protein
LPAAVRSLGSSFSSPVPIISEKAAYSDLF